VEVSQKYVENAEKRLVQLEKQYDGNRPLGPDEMAELKRLINDTKIPIREITTDKSLLALFTNQFAVRMNNGRRYKIEDIATVLRNSAS
jgi:hypothetical protein